MSINLGGFQVPSAWALAVVTALGYVLYVLGQYSRRVGRDPQVLKLEQELHRAQLAAGKLEKVVRTTRTNLRKHQTLLKGFRHKVIQIKGEQGQEVWEKLGREIEEILSPTIQLAAQIASAHDVIRYESSMLMTFTNLQTDPLTGVCNRRGLDQSLATQFAAMRRYGSGFSLVIFDIDRFKDINDQRGHLDGDLVLREVAKLLKQEAREVDLVARYGGDEFVILMPQTDLEGAIVMAERVRLKVEQTMSLTISGGVASAKKDDTPVALLLRGDSALYSAKVAGRNRVFCHDGAAVKTAANQPVAAVPNSAARRCARPWPRLRPNRCLRKVVTMFPIGRNWSIKTKLAVLSMASVAVALALSYTGVIIHESHTMRRLPEGGASGPGKDAGIQQHRHPEASDDVTAAKQLLASLQSKPIGGVGLPVHRQRPGAGDLSGGATCRCPPLTRPRPGAAGSPTAANSKSFCPVVDGGERVGTLYLRSNVADLHEQLLACTQDRLDRGFRRRSASHCCWPAACSGAFHAPFCSWCRR